MVGQGAAMSRLYQQMERIGPYFRTALITGETGTGKELVARAMHRLSPGAGGPFIVCNASAIVETLFESELFGHMKGAFTGATQDHIGLFEAAHGGTIFLDEIGEMPLSTQAKLLRVLQSQEVQRVGSTQSRRVEARVIAATNRDLRALAAKGEFRQDLYYRISMVEIPLQPLRSRPEDLPMLAQHFVAHFAEQYGKTVSEIDPAVLAQLSHCAWRGNVRELENVLGNAVMQVEGNTLSTDHLPPLSDQRSDASLNGAAGDTLMPLHVVAQRHIRHVLDACSGNKLRAAEMLGISRSTLYRMLENTAAC